MKTLDTATPMPAPDDFYATLIAALQGLSKVESDALNARLILILANQVADIGVLRQAIAVAMPSKKMD